MNIILVDDEQLNLDSLDYAISEVLPNANKQLFTKAKEALAYSEEHKIDIAFLDINMRGTDGVTMAKILQERYPRINIIFCTGYSDYALTALEIHCSGYLMKPITVEKIKDAMENLRYPINAEQPISVRCFGNFEVYCEGLPIKFKYARTRELLAYLIDRNGASCSLNEIAAVLFEDAEHRSYLYQMRLDLINTLADLGADDVVLQSRGYLAVNRHNIKCDYFDYLDKHIKPQANEYMSQFSWAEPTYASLFLKAQ